VKLETERLVLRRLTPDAADALAPIYGDPDVMRYIGDGTAWSRRRTEDALVRWHRFWEDDGFGQLAVERRDDARIVGDVGLLAWDTRTWSPGSRARIGSDAEIEVGWTLAREFWGHGYAIEAATAVRDWALGELGLSRLVSLIQPGNARSIRVAEKLGERYERDIVTHAGQTARLYALDAR
jgi:RimJ/RimL family protein N-acetyltransferase